MQSMGWNAPQEVSRPVQEPANRTACALSIARRGPLTLRAALPCALALTAAAAAAVPFACAAAQAAPQSSTQASAARPQPTGTVTGHVLCADTQRPARLAEVKLVRVPTQAEAEAKPAAHTFSDAAPAGDPVETSLDGSYTLHNVKPGEYYLVVDAEGYLLPLGAFSKKDLGAPDEAARTRLLPLHTITVNADQSVQADVTLERGAAVSGTVLYDDGSPASGIGVQLMVRNAAGVWTEARVDRYRTARAGYTSTDDYGHYRITGLPAGEYATRATLSLGDNETETGPMPDHPGVTMTMVVYRSRFSLPLYSGDVLRKKEAVAYTLGSGEAYAGSDLVLPISKLHKVGGEVIAKDGHLVNAGNVELLYADDRERLTETTVQYDDQAFHLDFVPEGSYLLHVSGAKDVARFDVPNAAGFTPPTHTETKTLRSFADAEQPLLVKGDVSDVLVTVPDPKVSR